MKKNNINLTDFKIKSIGSKLPKNVLKIKNILLKQLEKLHIEYEKKLKETSDCLQWYRTLNKYETLAKPLKDCLVEIIKIEIPFVVLEKKE